MPHLKLDSANLDVRPYDWAPWTLCLTHRPAVRPRLPVTRVLATVNYLDKDAYTAIPILTQPRSPVTAAQYYAAAAAEPEAGGAAAWTLRAPLYAAKRVLDSGKSDTREWAVTRLQRATSDAHHMWCLLLSLFAVDNGALVDTGRMSEKDASKWWCHVVTTIRREFRGDIHADSQQVLRLFDAALDALSTPRRVHVCSDAATRDRLAAIRATVEAAQRAEIERAAQRCHQYLIDNPPIDPV